MHAAETVKKCGAKTRLGTPCERLPCHGRTRCRLHGGASPQGFAHPRFQHGAYSSSWEGVLERAERSREADLRRLERAYAQGIEAYNALIARREAEQRGEIPRRRGRPRKLPDATTFLLNYTRAWMMRDSERRKKCGRRSHPRSARAVPAVPAGRCPMAIGFWYADHPAALARLVRDVGF